MKPILLRAVLRAVLLAGLLPMALAHATAVLTLDRLGGSLVAPGGSVAYSLRLTNAAAVIGAFSVDLTFDPAVLALLPPVRFGALLGDPAGETVSLADAGAPGRLRLDQVSLLDSAALAPLQLDGAGAPLSSLVLATLEFQAVGPGPGQLAFDAGAIALADADGAALAAPIAAPADVVLVVPVPAPATPLLLGLGLGLALLARRRLTSPA